MKISKDNEPNCWSWGKYRIRQGQVLDYTAKDQITGRIGRKTIFHGYYGGKYLCQTESLGDMKEMIKKHKKLAK